MSGFRGHDCSEWYHCKYACSNKLTDLDGARDTEGCGVGGRLGTEEGLNDTDGCGLGCRLGMEEGLAENDGEIVGCSDVVGTPEGIDDGCRNMLN